MRNIFFWLMIIIVMAVFSLNPSIAKPAESSSDRVLRILKELDDLYRSSSAHGFMSMQVKTAHYTRSMRLESWASGKDKSLIRIIAPIKERGTSTLMYGKNIYTYLPKTDRTIRLTSGMMGGSWMGSHFTNDDLIKESRMSEDYDATITFEGIRNRQSVIEFTLIPKPLASVVWGKIVLTIEAKNIIPVSYIFYDEDMEMIRTMTFSDVKDLGGRVIPAVLRVTPVDKPGEYTEVVYEKMEFKIPIKDSFFSIARLKKKK
jgi:outer membrane lipoprotein-sorting protein